MVTIWQESSGGLKKGKASFFLFSFPFFWPFSYPFFSPPEEKKSRRWVGKAGSAATEMNLIRQKYPEEIRSIGIIAET